MARHGGHIDVGTIGSRPSHVTLNKLLMEAKDQKVTHFVMKVWNECKDVVLRLKKHLAADPSLLMYCLTLVRDKKLEKLEQGRAWLPPLIYSYARCCVVGLFRDTMRIIHEAAPECNRRHSKTGKQRRDCWPLLFSTDPENAEETGPREDSPGDDQAGLDQ